MGIFDRISGTLDELVSATADEDKDAPIRDALTTIREQLSRGDVSVARVRVDDLARQHPRRADVQEARGEVLLATRDLDDAATAFGRVVDLEPSRATAWVRLGQVLADLARPEPARDALRRALAFSSLPTADRAQALRAIGEVYVQLGQPAKALRVLRKLVEMTPDDPLSFATLGRVLLSLGDREGADWLTRAGRLPGGDVSMLLAAARAHADRATTALAIGSEHRDVAPADRDAALKLLNEAADRAPSDADVLTARARRLADLGDWPSALAQATAATTLNPGEVRAWTAARDVFLRAGQFADAVACAQRETARGARLDLRDWLTPALGVRTDDAVRDAFAAAEADGDSDDDELTTDELRAFLSKTASADALRRVARLAPDEASRRFVYRSHAPSPPPANGAFGWLVWARDYVLKQSAPLSSSALPLAHAIEVFDRPLQVAVMGEFNAGKSSFVNALAGDIVARVGVTPTTATINILRHGAVISGRVRFHDGRLRDLKEGEVGPFLETLDDDEAARVRWVEIFSPAATLRRFEIVDTPGLNSLSAAHEQVAKDFLVEADAVVWVFAFGQAAKATERAALDVVHGAGKRVLGVINKVDGADDADLREVTAHTQRELGDRLAALIPFSARAALRAQKQGNAEDRERSGLTAVEGALEHLFFDHARQLKQATALATLRRLLADMNAAVDATSANLQAQEAALSRERTALRKAEAALRSTLAAERVALRTRIDRSIRGTAPDVREFLRPRSWPFGEPHVEAANERDLTDLLDDAVSAAIDTTTAAFKICLRDETDGLLSVAHAQLTSALDATTAAFEAYARGTLEGSAALFFRVDMSRVRVELPALSNLLATYAPDPETRFFRVLEQRLTERFADAHRDLARRTDDLELDRLAHEEQVVRPLAELQALVTANDKTN